MRRLMMFLTVALVVAFSTLAVMAQSHVYESEKVEYTLELPSAAWRTIAEPDSVHQHAEFIYGDRNDGYLRVRKEVVDRDTMPSELARRDQEQKLHFLPGYVGGKEEKFAGRLNGVVFSYEYTVAGKQMTGLIYYLQADNRTIYTLRFSGLRDKLLRIRNQTDLIARSFRMK